MLAVEVNLRKKLKEIFGYQSFRGIQEDIIQNILAGNDSFVLMPTGAGKSLCYQLPAIVSEGTAIVISPLIALMKNQVDQLNALGVNAQFLNSTLSKAEMTKVRKSVLAGETKLLYVAPESLTKENNLEFLQKANLSFLAIDEAHCISEWGHDFRPEYRRIRYIMEILGEMPIIALTATATPKVQLDIQKNLMIEHATVFSTSFNRPNLYYEVRPKAAVKKQIVKYIKSRKNESGIIYCLSRKKVEEVYEFLKVNDIKALPYHAGLDSQVRMQNQDAFLSEEADVIVATIAFGMGIDKPDVRFVIHYDTPKSLEGYYQETGRSGRDGLEADCIMFYSPHDLVKLEKFNKDKSVTERDNARHLLQEMSAYATSGMCRRRILLSYFGETVDKDCGFCNNCKVPTEKFTTKEQVLWVLEAVMKTEQRFGINHIVDVLRGERNGYINTYEQDKLDIYGKGKEFTGAHWTSVMRQMMVYNLLEKDAEVFGAVRLSPKGLDYVQDPYALTFSKDHDYENLTEQDEEDKDIGSTRDGQAFDKVLLDMLKELRRKTAKQTGYPPYAIFQEFSLEEMATTYPTTEEELAQINGVGPGKVKRYGMPFIELIKKYVKENDIETVWDVVVKSTASKSKLKIFVIQQIDRKVDLEDICEVKNMSISELLDTIESICYSGTRLNLDYYIEQVIDEDRQQEIYEYFMTAESDNIQVALVDLGDDYSEEELRLMRIKFLSEIAN
ncbi:MAG: DNA helicase RecQ [Bacteroidetes bacterium]|nr:MAG: DNA helicase RecQ [Bacteroidota bacterium]